MPNLGDYLGQLLSEIALARMQADLESVRIAEIYAAHPLLRTFPIPHLRLPEINLDVPVLIDASQPPREGETPRGGLDLAKLREGFASVSNRVLAEAGVNLSAVEQRRFAAATEARLLDQQVPSEVAIDVKRIADDLSATTIRLLREKPPRGSPSDLDIDQLEGRLRTATAAAFLGSRVGPPRLVARVTSQEIREAGPEGVTRLRLRITEQGLELTQVDGANGTQDRLVPE
jgi:hypothetical protein